MTDKQKNYIRAKAIEQKNKERILAVCSEATDDSGIYWFARSKTVLTIAMSDRQNTYLRVLRNI